MQILACELRARHSSEFKFNAVKISKFIKFNSVTSQQYTYKQT